MRNIFQHIRRQPKEVRDNYALGIAGSFTFVVLLLWVVALPSEGLLDAPEEKVEKLTPFATLISESKERFAAIKASIETASSTDSQAAVVTASTTEPGSIVLSEADIALALEKASSTQSTSTPEATLYTEVLIGTTTQSGTSSTTGSSSAQTSPSATVE